MNFQNYFKMSLSKSMFSKASQRKSLQIESTAKSYTIFHNLIVNESQYYGRESLTKNKYTKQPQQKKGYTNPKTSFYLCKRILLNQDTENLQTSIIKRLAYRRINKVNDEGKTIYNDRQFKNYDQIQTEYNCYKLLKNSHRAIQMKDFIHQNIKAKEDIKFFYNFLKLNDRRSQGIQNICFVLQQMNEGSLTQQIRKITQKKLQPFNQQTILEYTCQITEGLLQLRSKGIIHRDLRPDNILIHNGQIKFSDFDSAFIQGFSDWKSIKNGVQMKDTTPLQIMLLVSQTQQKLQKLTHQQLFQLQQKADIYFLGINIYSMIFMQPFETFNGGIRLNNLIKMKKIAGFCPQLLMLMQKCLQKKPEVRIQLDEVVKTLAQLQVKFYLKSSTYKRVYLSPEPLNLYSFSSNQIQQKLKSQQSSTRKQQNIIQKEQINKQFEKAIKDTIVRRDTKIYEQIGYEFMNNQQNIDIWYDNKKYIKFTNDRKNMKNLIEDYITNLKIKTYYYQLAFRILCEINLDSIKSTIYLFNIHSHLTLYLNQLSIVLTLLYDLMMRCSFTEDPLYEANNLGYENKLVKDNMRQLYSRRQFFGGRKYLMGQSYKNIQSINLRLELIKKESNQQYEKEISYVEQQISFFNNYKKKIDLLQKKVSSINSIQYQDKQRAQFKTQYKSHKKILKQIQAIAKKQMIQTIISLILAYQKMKYQSDGNRCNLKNAIFMLMILQTQNTDQLQKNDIVIIRNQLTTMINLKLGWKSQELQSFFNNYTQIHSQQLVEGLKQLPSQLLIEEQLIKSQKRNLTIRNLERPPEVKETKISQESHNSSQSPPQIKISKQQESNTCTQEPVFDYIEDSIRQTNNQSYNQSHNQSNKIQKDQKQRGPSILHIVNKTQVLVEEDFG